MDKLENIVEAILFLSGNAVAIGDIAAKLDVSPKEIEAAAKTLKDKYSGSSGVHIVLFNKKLQLSSNPDYSEMVESVLNPIKERELSKAMMEVAAIIAYKQPVTRLEIEEIRGVNSDYAVTMLTKHSIIEVVGRKDAIGKPLLYGTTDEFLKRFQLSALTDLPDYEDLIDRIKVLHEGVPPQSSDLYYREQWQENEQVKEDTPQGAAEAAPADITADDILFSKATEQSFTDKLEQKLAYNKNNTASMREAAATIDSGLPENSEEQAPNEGKDSVNDVTGADNGSINNVTGANNRGLNDLTDANNSGADTVKSNRYSDQSGDTDANNGGSTDTEVPENEELPDFLKDEKDLKVIK